MSLCATGMLKKDSIDSIDDSFFQISKHVKKKNDFFRTCLDSDTPASCAPLFIMPRRGGRGVYLLPCKYLYNVPVHHVVCVVVSYILLLQVLLLTTAVRSHYTAYFELYAALELVACLLPLRNRCRAIIYLLLLVFVSFFR